MRYLIAMLVAMSIAGTALSKPEDMDYYKDYCQGISGSPAEQVAACTELISSGTLTLENVPVVLTLRGYAWIRNDDPDRAVSDYDEALRLNPRLAIAYNGRGDAWNAKKDYGRALSDYNEAIRLNPREESAYNSLAWILSVAREDRLRNAALAVEYARKACELSSWENAEYLDTLAAAYAEAGQFSEAIRWQEKALENATYAKSYGAEARARIALYRSGKPYRE